MSAGLNIAIVSTNRDKYSETFIHQHIRRMPGNIHLLFDGYLPTRYSMDRGSTFRDLSDYEPGFFRRLSRRLRRKAPDPITDLSRYLRKNKIQLLFCEYGPSGVEMLPLARDLNIPLLVHFHGYDAYRQDVLESYGTRYPVLFREAAAVVCVSAHMRAQLQQLGCPPEKLHLIPYGVDLSCFRRQDHLKKEVTFIACGRFVEKKAPALTIRAFAKVLARLPGVTLEMIGDGELLEYCRVLTAKLGLRHALAFRGVLRPEEVAEAFNRAHVFVQHSLTTPQNDSEGTPLTILEAGACGLPVVATRHGGIPDVVEEGLTGFLVDEANVEAMAACMLQLAANPAEAADMGRSAAAKVRREYGIERSIAALCDLTERCVTGKDLKVPHKRNG